MGHGVRWNARVGQRVATEVVCGEQTKTEWTEQGTQEQNFLQASGENVMFLNDELGLYSSTKSLPRGCVAHLKNCRDVVLDFLRQQMEE